MKCADCFDCIVIGLSDGMLPDRSRDRYCKCKRGKWLGFARKNQRRQMFYRLQSVIENAKKVKQQFKRCNFLP